MLKENFNFCLHYKLKVTSNFSARKTLSVVKMNLWLKQLTGSAISKYYVSRENNDIFKHFVQYSYFMGKLYNKT